MSGSTSRVMEYDPFSQEFQADPFPVYRWMRDEAPVFYSEKWNWWALSRFEDVRAAATDPQTFLSYEGIDIDDTAKDQSGPGFLPDIDNPRHDQIRRMIQPQLLPNRIAEREDAVRAVVRGLIDAWRDRGTVDLAQELAWPMPNEVFFDLLGLPAARQEGRAQLERWVHELKDRKPDDARLTPVAKAATAGIQSYFVDLLHERRARPRADLVTHLVTADIDGVPFAEEDFGPASEVLGLMMVLFLGGVESTAGLTGTLFKLLAENPDQRALLRENPALIPDAVEEAIRLATPLQLVGRTTAREVTLHGVTIPAGGRVVLVYGAANRDERRFTDPDRFDVTRGRFRHLGFGEGMHGCLGAPLARLEAKVALEEALPVLGDYTIAGPPERYRTTPNMYVWDHLHLSFPVADARAPPARGDRAAPHHQRHRRHPRVRGRRPGGEQAAGRGRGGGPDPAADRRQPAAPVVAGRARRPDPGRGADPAVLALRRPGRPPPVAAGHPAGRGRRRRLPLRPRPAAGRRHGPGPRPAEQLRAGRLAPLPVHRGRDRHHPDPPDDRRRPVGSAPTGGSCTAAATGPRWRSSASSPATATGSPWRPRTRPGCSTWTRSWAPRSRTPWSTAAGPNPCWPPSRSAAAPGRPGRCTSSGSAPGR